MNAAMRRRLCSAMLILQAVVVGLTTPVLISITQVPVNRALVLGLGLALACIVVAGLLRFGWAYVLGWALQVASIAMGFLVSAMFTLGAVFLALWAAAYILGGKIDRERAAAYAALPES